MNNPRPGTSGVAEANPTAQHPATPAKQSTLSSLPAGVVVVTVTETTNGHTRRRCLFNLPSAQAAVTRAHARGLDATMQLCRLVPLDEEVQP